jgi:hypothetical protein
MTEPCNTANAAEALGLRKDARRQEIARRQAQLSWRHRLEPDEDQQQGLADCAAALLGARSERSLESRSSEASDAEVALLGALSEQLGALGEAREEAHEAVERALALDASGRELVAWLQARAPSPLREPPERA